MSVELVQNGELDGRLGILDGQLGELDGQVGKLDGQIFAGPLVVGMKKMIHYSSLDRFGGWRTLPNQKTFAFAESAAICIKRDAGHK